MNFFLYDKDKEGLRSDVIVFQGRRFEPSPMKSTNEKAEKVKYVTPDIGILMPSKNGVIGEVKKSFPANQEYWLKPFKQLMSYDDDLTGWPTDDGKVNSHDIVLILHQSRGARVLEFYEAHKETEIKIDRPFSIVEFNRSDEAAPYYFFRKLFGNISEEGINNTLKYGTPVPMHSLTALYSEIKLYDDEPPLPYLLELIWVNVVLQKACENERFQKLRKNQKIEVNVPVETIINDLHQNFSFRRLQNNESDRQPRIPKKEWIMRACKKFIELDEAKWEDDQKSIMTFFFRQYDDTLAHFIDGCLNEEQMDSQKTLFGEGELEEK